MTGAPLKERLAHIIAAADQLHRMRTGKQRADFVADAVLIAATERLLERICEAARHIPEGQRAAFPHIPWAEIRGLGNRLRHGYDAIDSELVCDIIVRDLAPLEPPSSP